MEATAGIEPANEGFADLCLTTWLRRLPELGKRIGESSERLRGRQYSATMGVDYFAHVARSLSALAFASVVGASGRSLRPKTDIGLSISSAVAVTCSVGDWFETFSTRTVNSSLISSSQDLVGSGSKAEKRPGPFEWLR